MDSVLGAEVLKTRKRWMPYVLFVVMIVGVLFLLFPAGYLPWKDNHEFDDQALRTFQFPYSLASLLDSGQFWGALFTGILAGSVVATEHNWGTVRQALIRGQSRSAYLATKLASITLMAAVMLLATLAIGLLLSVYMTDIADKSLSVRDGPTLGDSLLMVLRAGLGILPYGMLAFSLAVISRSSTLAITGIVVYLLGEAIGIALLESLGGFGGKLTDFSIGENAKSLITANRIGDLDYNSMAPRDQPPASSLPAANAAALVLLAHTAVYCWAAFFVFNRRDVRA